jgi:hypothetical protein
VVQWGAEHGNVDGYLREFLDEFYLAREAGVREVMLLEEPPMASDRHIDAYMGAVAEHLAGRYGVTVPGWASAPARFLKAPFFPCGLDSLKATLLVESPVAFRRRLIFVGSDPLYRPRRELDGRKP